MTEPTKDPDLEGLPPPVPKRKAGRPKGSKTKDLAEKMAANLKGALVLQDQQGEVTARLAISDLATDVLKEFGGYPGIAKAMRFTFENGSFAVKSKILQLLVQMVRQAGAETQPVQGLGGMTEKQLEQVYHERIILLAREGLLDEVMQKVGTRITGPVGMPIGAEEGNDILEVEARRG